MRLCKADLVKLKSTVSHWDYFGCETPILWKSPFENISVEYTHHFLGRPGLCTNVRGIIVDETARLPALVGFTEI